MRLVIIASLIGIASLAVVSGCSKTLSTSQKRGQAYYSLNCYDCHEENQLGLIKDASQAAQHLFPSLSSRRDNSGHR